MTQTERPGTTQFVQIKDRFSSDLTIADIHLLLSLKNFDWGSTDYVNTKYSYSVPSNCIVVLSGLTLREFPIKIRFEPNEGRLTRGLIR